MRDSGNPALEEARQTRLAAVELAGEISRMRDAASRTEAAEGKASKLEEELVEARERHKALAQKLSEAKVGRQQMELSLTELKKKFEELRGKLKEKGVDVSAFEEAMNECGLVDAMSAKCVFVRLYEDAVARKHRRQEAIERRLREAQQTDEAWRHADRGSLLFSARTMMLLLRGLGEAGEDAAATLAKVSGEAGDAASILAKAFAEAGDDEAVASTLARLSGDDALFASLREPQFEAGGPDLFADDPPWVIRTEHHGCCPYCGCFFEIGGPSLWPPCASLQPVPQQRTLAAREAGPGPEEPASGEEALAEDLALLLRVRGIGSESRSPSTVRWRPPSPELQRDVADVSAPRCDGLVSSVAVQVDLYLCSAGIVELDSPRCREAPPEEAPSPSGEAAERCRPKSAVGGWMRRRGSEGEIPGLDAKLGRQPSSPDPAERRRQSRARDCRGKNTLREALRVSRASSCGKLVGAGHGVPTEPWVRQSSPSPMRVIRPSTAMLRHLVGDSASKGTLLTYHLDSISPIF